MKKPHALLLFAISAAAILAATLSPAAGGGSTPDSFFCFLCGSRGMADAILNTLLFLPFGGSCGLLRGPVWAVAASGLFSGIVEGLQVLLPGRHPSLGDLVFNSLGGGLGALSIQKGAWPRMLLRRTTATHRMLSLLLPTLAFALSAYSLSPNYPDSEYFGQWTHDLGGLPRYDGEILSASVAAMPVPDGRLASPSRFRESLTNGDSIRFSFLSSGPPAEPRHLFGVFDASRREVFLFRVDGSDLLFTRSTLATRLRLDRPALRWRGVLPQVPGVTITVSAWQARNSFCLAVDSTARCTLPGGVEEGWRLLLRADSAPAWVISVLSFVFVFALCIPAGVSAESGRAVAWVGTAIGGAGMLISWLGPSCSPHLLVLVASLAGVQCGFWARRRATSGYFLGTAG